jgi:hypothetical protein
MAITYEQNWQREKSADVENIQAQNKDFMIDYELKLTKCTRELEGEIFKAKIICAKEKNITYYRNEKEVNASILDITFLIRDPRDNQLYHFTGGIYVDQGHQSNQLHDFLSLCLAQKANVLQDTFTQRNFGRVETYYPNMAGCLLVIAVATSGYNGDWQKYTFKCYAADNRSQEEIETNQPTAMQINEDLEWLRGLFADRHNPKKAKSKSKKTTSYGAGNQVPNQQMANSFPNQSYQGQNASNATPIKQSTIDDDLPF